MRVLKSTLLTSFYTLLLCATISAEPLKVMTWNLQWFPGGKPDASQAQKSEHFKAAGKVLGACSPDIFLAQELTDETAFQKLMGKKSGMEVHVFSRFLNFDEVTPAPQQCAIASKLEAHSAWFEPFKRVRNLPSLPRGFAFAALKHPDGGLMMFYCVHFKSNRGDETQEGEKNIAETRAESVRQIIRHKETITKKFSGEKILGWVIGGDFNTNHDGQFPRCTAIQDLTKAGFYNTWCTTPKKERLTWRVYPNFTKFESTTFDYIMTDGFKESQASVAPNIPFKVSDHAPVLLELSTK